MKGQTIVGRLLRRRRRAKYLALVRLESLEPKCHIARVVLYVCRQSEFGVDETARYVRDLS